jgi:hypothetical protein
MYVPPEVSQRLVFSAGAHDYRWADVVAAAEAWGRWQSIAGETAAGAAALELLPKHDVKEAAEAFRYERGLLAAEEMEAWLEHWGLDRKDWLAYLRRATAREQRPAARAGAQPRDEDVWTEAVCSGALVELARELAARTAVAEAGPVETDLERMDRDHAEFVSDALTPETAAKTLELRSADWVRLSLSSLELTHEGMAREAALLVREDGLSLAEVAGRSGATLVERDALVEDLEPGLATMALSAPEGELVGPLPAEDGFVLLCINKKVTPTLEDPLVQELLRLEVPARALEREVRNRVRWHERL